MVKALDTEDDAELERAREAIQEDPLSVEVRGDWYPPGGDGDSGVPGEYRILLCTGGPAIRIIGDLDESGEPYSAALEHQDWFTPWTELSISAEEEAALVRYAQEFYYSA